MKQSFYVGSYASVQDKSILRFELDSETGVLEKKEEFQGIVNPSYLFRKEDRIYAVQEENPNGFLHTLCIGKNGLSHLGVCSTNGADPCHITFTHGKLLAANYSSGSMASFTIDSNGVAQFDRLIEHHGSSAHPTRQASAHTHFVHENGNVLYAVDLGMDKVLLYDPDTLEPLSDPIPFEAGMGPRHLAFSHKHPNMIYAVCELGNEIHAFRKQNGRYELAQRISTQAEGESIAAAIHINGDRLFVSNRGHDSIAMFQILNNGLLEPVTVACCGGRWPRDFQAIGSWIVCANQESRSLTVLKIVGTSLVLSGDYPQTIQPTCICLL